ncbi:hypothetical protein [Moorena sp. SIO3I6]|uniref:hypothetical protein n=1 Tax=Moorena sp. SIO3I6 TaxID=2607831 RepID=UPI0013FC03EB|nr:hypothetical protein [Moorena sp. SIO3I6]NEP29157.1 hypothetical protein [Moorena sp. SIO3I6]
MVDVRGTIKKPVSHTIDSYTFLEGHANTALGDKTTIPVYDYYELFSGGSQISGASQSCKSIT